MPFWGGGGFEFKKLYRLQTRFKSLLYFFFLLLEVVKYIKTRIACFI